MHKSGKLAEVKIESIDLVDIWNEKTRNDRDTVYPEQALKIVDAVRPHQSSFLIRLQFEKVQNDIDREANVDEPFKCLSYVLNLFEHEDDWSHEHGIYCESVDKQGPKLGHSVICPYDVPYPLLIL